MNDMNACCKRKDLKNASLRVGKAAVIKAVAAFKDMFIKGLFIKH